MIWHAFTTLPRMRRITMGVCLLIMGLFVAPIASVSAKPALSHLSRIETSHLPHVNREFRHPAEAHQLFFLQRTLNANTVVYTTHFDHSGKLNQETPVSVYWRRFQENGQVMPLRWYERVFGFGVKLRKTDKPNTLHMTFNGLKSHPLELRQTAPFTAALYARFDDRDYRLIYAYLDVDESGLFPKVTRLRLYTHDPETGLFVTHTIAVSGGAYTE